jgi:hypothetical protein
MGLLSQPLSRERERERGREGERKLIYFPYLSFGFSSALKATEFQFAFYRFNGRYGEGEGETIYISYLLFVFFPLTLTQQK